ncbi:NAD-dependent epimerase/dehydratase family protein [Modestobacter sp. Leaf380]|uniref:NAD-dependent epimerase/dehydratase family protein n=1 Tax=Modestobacter sp. Leaf380 TaxID=1736356 RepID=UPI0009EC0DAC|nr:NAD-dependent epimerase/dehydratase family protein [Modestobacter sp. Leaf380]
MTAAQHGDLPVITDVAREAGVSYQTVSRVINASGPVRASTRARVLAAIEVLGWSPNEAAQSLSRRRTVPETPGAETPGAENPGAVRPVLVSAAPGPTPASLDGTADVDETTPAGAGDDASAGGTRPSSLVLVTGGSGKLGRATVDHLLAEGHRVVVVDLVAPHRPDVPWTRADLTDPGQALEVLSGIDDRWERPDAVVHLAAIPAPGLLPDATLFATNITTTYNVFAAARRVGITEVVWASSETVLGLPLDVPPPSFPLDEETGPTPTTSYSLSKTLEEEMARQFARWCPEMKLVGLRLSNVMAVEDYAAFPSFDADAALRRWNGWSYIDARDAARAISAGLRHPDRGADVFVIANGDTVMSRPTAELAALEFPGVPVHCELGQHTALMSTEKARRVLGWVPAHTWRDHVPGR